MIRYEQYKDSGVAWAPQIPYDWKVYKGKNILNLMQREVRKDDDVVTCFRDGEVVLRSLRRTDGFTMSDKEIGYQGINIGDIVIHGMDGFAGAMGVSKSQGKGTPVYVVCTPQNGNNENYIIYYLRFLAYNNVFLALSTGIRERSCDLKWNKISVLPFLVPNHLEQQAIADHLDRKCGEIDELIGLQEKMIEELGQYKQSVITEAVTRGLNPDAPLKDSGIEWIGKIPEHWYIVPIKYLCINDKYSVKTGPFGTQLKGEDLQDEGEIRVYNQKNVIYNDFYNITYYVSEEKAKSLESFYTRPNDLLLTSRGTIGKSAILPDNVQMGILHPCLIALRLKTRLINMQFLQYYINETNCFKTDIQLKSNSTTIEVIYTEPLKCVNITVPPLHEQQAIAAYLDRKCKEIDELTEIKKQKIVQLKEYKKSVIYEYVTGKKRVNI